MKNGNVGEFIDHIHYGDEFIYQKVSRQKTVHATKS